MWIRQGYSGTYDIRRMYTHIHRIQDTPMDTPNPGRDVARAPLVLVPSRGREMSTDLPRALPTIPGAPILRYSTGRPGVHVNSLHVPV